MSDLIDIFNKDEIPLNEAIPYEKVRDSGDWHRGVHAIIYTSSGLILMQKRSSDLDYHPGLIEVSVGGGVVHGETIQQAMVREIQEETGLKVKESDLIPIGKMKFNRRYKVNGKWVYMRDFIYSFKYQLPSDDVQIIKQPGEVKEAFFITKKELRKAIRSHWVKSYGRLSSLYSYWRFLLKSIDKPRPKSVLFVCQGNTYRSRLAEAISKKHYPQVPVQSAGIAIFLDKINNMSPVGLRIAKKKGIDEFLADDKQQFTQELADQFDLVVFMNKNIYEAVKDSITVKDYLVWDVFDLWEQLEAVEGREDNQKLTDFFLEESFRLIENHINKDIKKLAK